MRKRHHYWYEAHLDLLTGEILRLESRHLEGQIEYRVILVDTGEIVWTGRVDVRLVQAMPYDTYRSNAMGLLGKIAKKVAERGCVQGKPDTASRKKYPLLVELMTEATDEAGNARELSSLTVKFQDGTWRIGVHEPNLEVSMWASAGTLDSLLEAVESRLGAEDADWRAWTGRQSKTAGRAKK